MRRFACLASAVLTAVAVTACTSDVDVPADSASATCDPLLEPAFRAWGTAGFSGVVVVSGSGAPQCELGVGMAERAAKTANAPDTVYAIGSISKTFAAAAVLQLEADGKLRRSDRAGTLLPGLTGPAAQATVEQLLLHSSGLTGSHGQDDEPLARDAAIRALSRMRSDAARVGKFLYSNAGYSLLALIVDELSPDGYRSYLADRILRTGGGFWDGDPAAPGPRAVGYSKDGTPGARGDFPGPYWALAGNGDLAMTMPQLAAWTRALFAGEIVSPAAVEALLDPGVTDEEGREMSPGWVHFDSDTFGEPVYATAGGGGDVGQNVVLAWLPQSQRVVAFASNTADLTAEELLQKVAPALVAGDPLPTPASAGPVGAPAAGLAGTYRTSDGALVVEADAEGLLIRAQSRSAFAALLPTTRVEAAEVAAHETAVQDLLAGRTDAGRDELALLAKDEGTVTRADILGSVVDEGELRTYVRLHFDGRSVVGWYAVNSAGGIEGVDLGTGYPGRRLIGGAEGYRVAGAEEIAVNFTGSRVSVAGPGGTVTGERS